MFEMFNSGLFTKQITNILKEVIPFRKSGVTINVVYEYVILIHNICIHVYNVHVLYL